MRTAIGTAGVAVVAATLFGMSGCNSHEPPPPQQPPATAAGEQTARTTPTPATAVPPSPTVTAPVAQPVVPTPSQRSPRPTATPPTPAPPKIVRQDAAALAPSTRPSTALSFSPKSIDAILAGTKTATIRKGYRPIGLGRVTFGDAARAVPVVVLRVTHKTVGELSADDAKADGSGTVDAAKAALAKVYPGIAAGDAVTVVEFRPANP